MDNDLDALAITETWLRGDVKDDAVLAELVPASYKCEHIPRLERGGGGVALLLRDRIPCQRIRAQTFTSFEHIECLLGTTPPIRIIVVYRPPPSSAHYVSFSDFMDDLDTYVQGLMTGGRLLIIGDFNVHMNQANSGDLNAAKLVELVDWYNLVQHINEPTHVSGHTLDLVLTGAHQHLLQTSVSDCRLSDHFIITCRLQLLIPLKPTRRVTYRAWKKVNPQMFAEDQRNLNIESVITATAPDERVNAFNSLVSTVAEQHAPSKTTCVPQRAGCDWYCMDIRSAKQERRRCENRWRKTGLVVHRDEYVRKKAEVNKLVQEARVHHLKDQIQQCQGDSKKLFGVMFAALGRNKSRILPPGKSDLQLAMDFRHFFDEKIRNVRITIDSADTGDETFDHPTSAAAASLSAWIPVSEAELKRIIMESPTKHCSLDPIPTSLLKQLVDTLLPSILEIINDSLTSGMVQSAFKVAQVVPMIKKPSLDPSALANYRPVSNLPFVSKVLERVINQQLSAYLTENALHEPMQSAYRKHHSTETALVRVQHDILTAMSGKQACLLVLLDLSSAFDTVDHDILLCTLRDFGISGVALRWFASYLQDRTQFVAVGEARSPPHLIQYGFLKAASWVLSSSLSIPRHWESS